MKFDMGSISYLASRWWGASSECLLAPKNTINLRRQT
jgi:hypothetical protein